MFATENAIVRLYDVVNLTFFVGVNLSMNAFCESSSIISLKTNPLYSAIAYYKLCGVLQQAVL